ncbi:flagellar hook-associated protein FlgL [Anaerosolibacter sp.]|uniref:flagellar hook-associated protein FlgL n=1 Tax=Anaerosolibacter sp. TaxID=1872527 RepID=UPI00261D7DED|nr:flagellar hook-associated protein FlgL [Anaerosolibacter sp.]
MRITNSMMNSKMLQNLNNNLRRLDKHQMKLATGKNFNVPSDNPVGVSKSLGLNTAISELQQYKRNSEDAISWLEITESAIEDVQEIIHRAKELSVQLGSGTYSDADRVSGKQEIDQLKEQLIKIANTTFAGKHIFTGFKTNQSLLDVNGLYTIDTSNNEKMMFEVGIGDTIDINILGHKLFGRTAEVAPPYTSLDGVSVDTGEAVIGNQAELLSVFEDLSNALGVNDPARIQTSGKRLDKHLENILSIRGEVGSKVNRAELTLNRIQKDIVNVTGLLSKNEDADMAEVIMQFKNDENIYRASLSTGAKAIQPTLIDFIK